MSVEVYNNKMNVIELVEKCKDIIQNNRNNGGGKIRLVYTEEEFNNSSKFNSLASGHIISDTDSKIIVEYEAKMLFRLLAYGNAPHISLI